MLDLLYIITDLRTFPTCNVQFRKILPDLSQRISREVKKL